MLTLGIYKFISSHGVAIHACRLYYVIHVHVVVAFICVLVVYLYISVYLHVVISKFQRVTVVSQGTWKMAGELGTHLLIQTRLSTTVTTDSNSRGLAIEYAKHPVIGVILYHHVHVSVLNMFEILETKYKSF